ncbi:UNVERIFIED_CONTAM: hypothetical protein FKN15_023816 [Acipenser sinensis]
MADHSPVLRKNVTGSELFIEGLDSAQQYHVVITGYLRTHVKVTYKGIITTKKAENKAAVATLIVNDDPLEKPETEKAENKAAEATLIVNDNPLEKPETANEHTDPCAFDFDSGMQCKEYQAKWFFDKKSGICTQFWYGGCGGNANKFKSETECINQCLNPCLPSSHLRATASEDHAALGNLQAGPQVPGQSTEVAGVCATIK